MNRLLERFDRDIVELTNNDSFTSKQKIQLVHMIESYKEMLPRQNEEVLFPEDELYVESEETLENFDK